MYVCMYVCMYDMYICIYVCMCVVYITCYSKFSLQDALRFAGKDFSGVDTMVPQGGVARLPSWAGLRNMITQVNKAHMHVYTHPYNSLLVTP